MQPLCCNKSPPPSGSTTNILRLSLFDRDLALHRLFFTPFGHQSDFHTLKMRGRKTYTIQSVP